MGLGFDFDSRFEIESRESYLTSGEIEPLYIVLTKAFTANSNKLIWLFWDRVDRGRDQTKYRRPNLYMKSVIFNSETDKLNFRN